MAITPVIPSTFKPEIAKNGVISSSDLRSFVEGVSSDIAVLADTVNTIAQSFNTLRHPNISSLDGTNIVVDASASLTKDFSLLYSEFEGRALTVYEAFMFFMQILANTENGLREGISVGIYSYPATINAGESIAFDWPFADSIFEPFLFQVSGDVVSRISTLTITVDTSVTPSQLLINNTTGDTVNIYGYIWHPVFTF